MEDWNNWAPYFALGSAVAALWAYFLCSVRLTQCQGRILMLEREVAMARLREEANEKKMAKILQATNELRQSTEDDLKRLRERLDKLRAEGRLGDLDAA